MKFIKILLAFSIVFSFTISATDIKITDTDNHLTITEKSLTEFTFVNHLSDIQTMMVKTKDGDFVKLIVSGYGENAKHGNAELPVLEELINVPMGAEVVIQILNKEEEIISLSDYGINNLVFPSQPSISKGENAEDVPFYFNENYYAEDDFYTHKLITTEYLGKIRGQQLARISVAPFQYNPVTNQLKVVTKLEVRIIFKNTNITSHLANKQRYYSAEFEHLFKSCLNYLPMQEKDVITTYPVKYVIVADPAFQTALQPLVQWKTKKGFMVVEGYTNDPLVGNTDVSIHAYLKNMYDSATITNPAPTYLLIVGDNAEVPSFNMGAHVSDMYFCEFDGGGDFYPEMYYGRFSATTVAQVEAQVYKTLTHEKYTFSDPSFLDEVVLVAGVDASMAPTYGNGQINYGTDYYFNVAHGLTVHNYLYGSGTPITSEMPGASAAIIANVSAGVSFANYTAHCGASGWSDPSFSTSDVPGLDNYDEFGFMVGNCCQSNMFNVPVCFGEALLREDNKGAVGYIGGSNNTYWNEDFWWAVGNGSISANPTYAGTGLALYDCLMHENGEQQADWFITAGQMIHAGNLAVTQAGGAEQYYWEIYHLMGDPSLMPYIGVPTLLTVSHGAATPVGTTTFSVNTEENAYVAISMNGVLLDAQLADVTGIVNLTFPAIANVGTVDIVVTKQFKQPYQGMVQIISPNGPYVIYATNTIDDIAGNNNSLVDYNELISMDVDVQNIGSINANSVNVTLSTTDPAVTVINNSAVITIINPSQILSIPTPFTFQVANNITDQHVVVFNLDMIDNLSNTWSSTINILLNAPVLDHTTFTIDDVTLGNGNGKLDAGETLDLVVDVTNIGHADIANLTATLGCLTSYVTVNSTTSNVASLAVNGQQATIFNISINANTPVGTLAQFPFDLTDGVYSHNNTFSQTIGIIDEDYETGDFTQYAWVNDPVFPWTIDNSNVYEGNNSSRSGAGLPDGEVSHLDINVDVTAPGDISFYKFVSSEQDYDFLQFYIDGNKQGEWSGIDNAWSFVSFPVTVGNHDLQWEYDKDGSTIDGQDCAWLDYIVFPPIDLGQTTNIDEATFNFEIFPNPTMGSFNILFNDNKIHTVELFDVNGKMITTMNNQSENSSFNLKEVASGTYTVKVMPENITYQIVKQ
ncbi:MAG TPA: T9SS type A sorting domain-containing protein [Flavobacteriales bacterium]|nr:T9SS type A sorting domain-containing protein [Flavobacteriales bacterium]